MATHSSILAWEILGTEEPGDHSPWGPRESEMTEATQHTRQGDGEGREAWQAAVHGVAKSWT